MGAVIYTQDCSFFRIAKSHFDTGIHNVCGNTVVVAENADRVMHGADHLDHHRWRDIQPMGRLRRALLLVFTGSRRTQSQPAKRIGAAKA